MCNNFPSNIPKFEGKQGDDLTNHIMSFYLWHSSNNIVEDFVRLHLFQRILIGTSVKWYTNIPRYSHTTFGTITTTCLTYLQLPIRHDLRLKILIEFQQNTSTHIVDHIHTLWRHCMLRKIEIQHQFLFYWFLKSPQSGITKDVATSMPQYEE